jgi:hypothetical protein
MAELLCSRKKVPKDEKTLSEQYDYKPGLNKTINTDVKNYINDQMRNYINNEKKEAKTSLLKLSVKATTIAGGAVEITSDHPIKIKMND